jgi:UDP-N-acetylglucosamine--N-acetylmuramyl-(pentapeptide) pyrophosphoryl-undecaprenol N-acetylglucosamine transferase
VSRTIVLATGGTGGHIFPAEALAETLLVDGHTPVFITDVRFLPYAQKSQLLPTLKHHVITAMPLAGSPLKKITALWKNALAFATARAHLQRIKPMSVVGFGGYPSLPTMLAASSLGIPTILHEQNALLGKTNRVALPRVSVVATSFSHTQGIAPQHAGKVRHVGNPVRAAVRSLRDAPYLLPERRVEILVTGGSQGASVFGEVIPSAIALLPEAVRARVRLVQQVRYEQQGALQDSYSQLGVDAELAPFFTDMPERLRRAHLVIARAGASTVAELTCAGRPAILVPLPIAAEDHQTVNAKAFAENGAGWVMPQASFTPEALAAQLESILAAAETLPRAAVAAHALGQPYAAQQLASLVLNHTQAAL